MDVEGSDASEAEDLSPPASPAEPGKVLRSIKKPRVEAKAPSPEAPMLRIGSVAELLL